MKAIEHHLLPHLNEFVAFARRRLRDPELAADAVQESLLKAVKSRDELRAGDRARAWFFRILRRTLIDLCRRREVLDRAVARWEQELNAPPTRDEERLACRCLRRLLPTLSSDYAILIRRLELEDETAGTVARDLGITVNNLNVRRHRARRQLKRRLEETCRLCSKHGCLDCTCA